MSEKIITTKKEKEKRKHNHFPMGKTGYDPKVARLMNRDDIKKKKEHKH